MALFLFFPQAEGRDKFLHKQGQLEIAIAGIRARNTEYSLYLTFLTGFGLRIFSDYKKVWNTTKKVWLRTTKVSKFNSKIIYIAEKS